MTHLEEIAHIEDMLEGLHDNPHSISPAVLREISHLALSAIQTLKRELGVLGQAPTAAPDFETWWNSKFPRYDQRSYSAHLGRTTWEAAQSSLASQLSAMERAKNAAMTLAHEREAEIKRLTNWIGLHRGDTLSFSNDLDAMRLRAETAEAELDLYRGDLSAMAQLANALSDKRRAAEAEVARLREALDAILTDCEGPETPIFTAWDCKRRCILLARAALAPLEPK